MPAVIEECSAVDLVADKPQVMSPTEMRQPFKLVLAKGSSRRLCGVLIMTTRVLGWTAAQHHSASR